MDINSIIIKYLANECSSEEKLVLEEWVQSSSKNQQEFELLKTYWEQDRDHLEISKKSNWEKLQQNIHTQTSSTKTYQLPVEKPNGIGSLVVKIAASLLLLIGVWFVYQQYQNKALLQEETVASTPTIIEREIPWGRKSTIKLSDGTLVKMNSGSTIKFPEKFSGDTREIELIGEAYLEVVKDPSRPFIVKTGSVQTRVLGTSFNVKAIPGQTIQIALVEGSVQVSDVNTKQEMLLAPGEMITAKTEIFEKSPFDYKELIAWKDGLLVFKNASPEVIISKLEKWYGFKIIVQRKLSRKAYTSTFSNESLEEVLNIISESKDFQFKIIKEEEKVIIW
ncbi:MAG: hypothetical protein CMO01_28340 [Thalassobius sp.]|nr:hypothetical protein [Thalassovita sp.]